MIANYIDYVRREWYKEWKYELHCFYMTCWFQDVALNDPLEEFQERTNE